MSQYYNGDVDVMCNSSCAYFPAIVLRQPTRLLQHLMYFISHETSFTHLCAFFCLNINRKIEIVYNIYLRLDVEVILNTQISQSSVMA